MRTADFDYPLPPELIAQVPSARRDASRLLVLERKTGSVAHRQFPDLLEYLQPNDVLVLNDSRVIPARLRGRNARTGGSFEILLLEENAPNDWWAMLRPGKRGQPGAKIEILDSLGSPSEMAATVRAVNPEGHRRLEFSGADNLLTELERLGEVPLPPYIQRPTPSAQDTERYQTVFARVAGSVAAPTAGLHFTPEFLEQVRMRGVRICFITLHVGPGTFAPVKADSLAEHVMHEERYEIDPETARLINQARSSSASRIIAVGTTTTRVLESVAANHEGRLVAGAGRTRIFIHPPYDFKMVDGLVTNFHLPCSTLLMLVSAFAGREKILSSYREAVAARYRFFSYGDAMLIV